MAAAFELTRPELGGRFEVTVYQMGWRLGGKGASGRGLADRIEEHGLHLWMGFYENAFRIMRECYAELGRDRARCPIADWQDAFFPANLNTVADRSRGGAWTSWHVLFPPRPGLPGDPDAGHEPRTAGFYLASCVSLLGTLLRSLRAWPDDPALEAAVEGGAEALLARMRRFVAYGRLATAGVLLEALGALAAALRTVGPFPSEVLLALHDSIAKGLWAEIETLTRDDELRRLWEIVDLVLAVVRGGIRFGLATDPRGFDAIDDYDCREWLLLNGAQPSSVQSAFVRGLYDLAFAYEDGDVRRPRIAAGQALRGAVRAFFTYRGSFFWKMRAGMGDVVFAPLYEVLRRRGVRFQFFHRLEALRVADGEDGGRPHISALELDVQAEMRGGKEYRPLVDVRGLPCWPSRPDYDQLRDGARLEREAWDFESPWDRRCTERKVLEVGKDFDLVVLGVGIGALPHVARDLVARDQRWRMMIERCKSVPTQAFQIWLGADAAELGWPHGPTNLSGFVEPFDTWADMSHLADQETWPRRPAAIAYFCSVLADHPGAEGLDYAAARTEEVRQSAVRFLDRDIVRLWPNVAAPGGGFRWDLLVDPEGVEGDRAPGAARFGRQYYRANVTPSDRYALALPGTLRHRISPLDDSYDNLAVAGDWTDCGFNEGCVEAAVMSGRLAAHALSESPTLEEIIGFDHP
jgi:uncharacterized protein with NAD-binding domain and iron-sulfur cluster